MHLKAASVCVFLLACVLHSSVMFADSFGVFAEGQEGTIVPAVFSDGSQEIVDGANVASQSFDTGSFLPQAFFTAPPTSSSQQVTYFDPLANGIFTSSAAASIFTATIAEGLMRSWIGTSSQNVDADTGAQAGASDELDWVDTLTLRSPILPVGTPVDLLVRNHLSAFLDSSGNVDQARLDEVQQLADPADLQAVTFFHQYNCVGASSNICAPSVDETQVLSTRIGAPLNLQEQITSAVFGSEVFSGTVNAISTAYLNITPLTSGVVLTSASGIDYRSVGTPVALPEPGSLVLLGAGLIGLVTAVRRKSAIKK